MKDFINWDAEKGIATCTLIAPDGTTITKTAQCAEEDQDMMSEKTGCTIAQMRATIALSKHIRDYIIKPELYALKNFLHNIEQSPKYNPNSYESKRLLHKIGKVENDLHEIQELIAQQRIELSTYLKAKSHFYTAIRRLRKAKSN